MGKTGENYVTLVCERCGEEYERHENNTTNSRWCSLKCQQGTLAGEKVVDCDSGDWYRQRRRALDRDDYLCQNCGVEVGWKTDPETADAHVHHKTPVMRGGTHKLENLETLCADCHRKHHAQEGV